MQEKLRNYRVNFRCTKDFKEILDKISKNTGISETEIIINAVLSYIGQFSDDKIKKMRKEMLRKKTLKEEKIKFKQESRDSHFLSNSYRSIAMLAYTGYTLTGTINHNLIRMKVKHALKVFKSLPDNIKENQKEELKEFERFKNAKYFEAKIKGQKQIILSSREKGNKNV